jgi:hypothetical protein
MEYLGSTGGDLWYILFFSLPVASITFSCKKLFYDVYIDTRTCTQYRQIIGGGDTSMDIIPSSHQWTFFTASRTVNGQQSERRRKHHQARRASVCGPTSPSR